MTDLHQPATTSTPARTDAALIGSAGGGWDNGYLNLGGIDFWVQHAWATATYGATSHKFPCFGGPQGAECYPGTSYCANPASLFRLSDMKQIQSSSIDVDMVLAILVCTGIRETDPYKWLVNYDCTTNTGCAAPEGGWTMGQSSGILYGLTGVCHQAANRILAATNGCVDGRCAIDPARTFVTQPFPTGILSWLLYGPLGLNIDVFWQTVEQRYSGRQADSILDVETHLLDVHFTRGADIALRRPVIAHFILNDPAATDANPAAVEDAVAACLVDKLHLDADLVTGAMHPHAFALEVNRRAAELLKRLGEIAGEAWYRKHAPAGAVLNFACPLWMADAEVYKRFAHLAPARPQR
ncbi:hypothetical protein JQ557_15045 [Bradyrhizobium sp. U87765 SZCCT0131]|uniref:hypothetical protein n=1 Tax=unclassified Bradyrhizobium TaxID=2631580 RepID=UPI001BAD71CB|nr:MULTISPECIES: hypothetical protein [unclassified Bradyrhizobium]MBR1219317.1 hypothetical protein [Bradyrhizobium sp. U87765 SZCCT0131]MBR1261968.1 hypothetical protein [Bradyrhizobium sp. U87765 SZCCT0134]MBR1306179.1 hypothetical protein [Bradyrhizobium sp. U87765 SZCCT0110]MBR1317750.1 hypothetical protein [Bradyrhizobium sp. U87765 SZCCT0109]MBR1351452.1 hypothetical protein [Bradyrhizobium sp. U87765 SZCCT0048]